MKKVVISFISIMIVIFIMILYMVSSDNKNSLSLELVLKDKIDISEINYLNKYNDYYLVEDSNYLYLIDKEYKIISKLEIELIHKNINNYAIIYEDDKIYYLNDYIDDDKMVYEYYDIYSYEMIKQVLVGG